MPRNWKLFEDIEELRPEPNQTMRRWLQAVMETNIGIVTTFLWFSGLVFWLWLFGSIAIKIFNVAENYLTKLIR